MSNFPLAAAVLGLVALQRAQADTGRVLMRARADGVQPALLSLLNAWEAEGTHVVMVAPNGGLRTSASLQAQLAGSGASDATTLEQTPHGRGCALDVWPVEFPQYVNGTWQDVPDDVKAKFLDFGRFAEARGLKWGGRWRGPTFPDGDQPHLELPSWRSYPYPPRTA